jgi:hypothetical protein
MVAKGELIYSYGGKKHMKDYNDNKGRNMKAIILFFLMVFIGFSVFAQVTKEQLQDTANMWRSNTCLATAILLSR